ncbi:glycosyltransferase family 2 protein [Tardisphaera miroshnichenkoae]
MHSQRISVIVTAYDRRKYLLGAVKSALNQTLPRDLYEVIVVKNFRDEFIDSKLSEWGVTNLCSESQGFGAMIYEALQGTGGEVISFLDDDDEFLPGKLQAVYEAFQRDVDYYHNSQQYVNEAGRILWTPKNHSHFIEGEDKPKYLRFFAKYNADFNSSSIAVRRDVLERHASYLKKVEAGVDTFYFVASLVNSGALVLDGRPLTRYRFSASQSDRDLTNVRAFAQKRASAALRLLKGYTQMLEIVKGTPYEDFVRLRIAEARINYAAYDLSRKPFERLAIDDLLFLPKLRQVLDARTVAWLVFDVSLQLAPKSFRRSWMLAKYQQELRVALGSRWRG